MSIGQPIPIPVPRLGLLSAIDAESVPAEGLSQCENWIFRDRNFRVRNGLTAFGDSLGARPTGFIHYDHSDGQLRAVGATIAGWKVFNFTSRTWTAINGTALSASTEQQVFRVFQKSGSTLLLGVNNKDTPKKWDGVSDSYSDIGGTPPIARCMMVLNNHVMLGNLKTGSTISPIATDVSAFNDPDTGWGSIQVALHADTSGEIVIMQEMGNLVGAIIKTDAIHRATAQGGVDPFRFDYVSVPKDEGAAATLAYVVLSDSSIVYLSLNGKLKRYDLTAVTDFGGDNARVYLGDTIDFTSIGRSWMAYDSQYREILIVYPQRGGSGEPDRGLIVKESTGAIFPIKWGTREFSAGAFMRVVAPLTLGDLRGVALGSITKTLGELGQGDAQRVIVSAESNGQAHTFSGTSDNGTPIDILAETGLTPLNGGANLATVNSIEHRFERTAQSQPLTVKIGVSKAGEQRTLATSDVIDIGEPGPYYSGHRVTSKYLSMRLEGSASKSVVWKGSFVDAAQRGRWR